MNRTSYPRRCRAIFAFLLVIQGGFIHGALTLVSGEANVSANAIANGEGNPKSDSAQRNAIPGEATLSVLSVKSAGQNSMQVTGACTLQSSGDGQSATLRGSAGPSADGLTNNTSDPIIEGIGRGSVKYTFTIDSEYQWSLFAVTSGSVQNRGGGAGNVNRTDNNATVRLQGIFEQSISGTDSKQQELSGTIPAGTYVLEGVAQTAATGSQITRANISFGLFLTPTNTTTVRWNNPEGGSFQEASNWEPQRVPTANDIAAFDLSGNYTVTLDANVTNKALRGNGTGVNPTFEMRGHTYTADRLETGGLPDESISFKFTGVFAPSILSSTALNIPEPQPLSRAVFNDVVLSETDKLRYFEAALLPTIARIEGQLTLDNGSVLNATELTIGNKADGATLTVAGGTNAFCDKATVGVEAGGVFTASGAGTIAISDAETIFLVNETLTLGKAGTGTLTLSGGRADLAGDVILGAESGSSGSIEMTSGRLEAGNLTVGRGGTGTMLVGGDSISAGGASIRFLEIGHDPDNPDSEGSGIVRVEDSGALLLKGDVVVGKKGTLEAEFGQVRQDFDSQNPGALLPGLFSVRTGGKVMFSVGSLGLFDGVRIESGGSFSISNTVVRARAMTTLGEVQVIPRGVLEVKKKLTVQGAGKVSISLQGQVNVGEGIGDDGRLRVGPNGILAGDGTIAAEEILIVGSGSNEFTGARVEPGTSPGRLTLEGNFTQQPGSRIVVEAAGVQAGEFDVLHVTGNSSFGGTLEVLFVGGYLPKAGDSFAFLEVDGTVTGNFAEVVFPQLAPGFKVETQMVKGKFQLTALNEPVLLPVKGTFRSVLVGDPPGHESGGFLTIRLSSRDRFSAQIVLGGKSFTLRGVFDANGQFTGSIPRKGNSPLAITLQRPPDVLGVITGTISDGAHSIDILADRTNPLTSRKNPAPQAGQYAALLQFDSSVPDSPQANGIGVVKVSSSGAIRFAGVLPDGTALSQGAPLSRAGEWPLFVQLYKKQGSLVGTLRFGAETGGDFDGLLRWSRPATPDDKVQTAGFVATLGTIGSRFVAPPAQPAILDLPNGATAIVSDLELTPPLNKALTLVPPDKFVVANPGPDQFALRATSANGLLLPQFVHPATGTLTKGRGVVFQKQNRGSGFYTRPGRIGAFELQPNP